MTKTLVISDEFSASQGQLISVFGDVESWNENDSPRFIDAKNNQVKLSFIDRTRAVITFEVTAEKVRVNLRHEFISSDEDLILRTTYWKKVLSEFHKRLDITL